MSDFFDPAAKEICSVGELVEFVTDQYEERKRIIWFRGHSTATWQVQPSLWRSYTPEQERNFLRMFVQQGAFTIHSDTAPLNRRPTHSKYLLPLLIKAANVQKMAKQIHACGIVRGDIFPDLQSLAEEFKGLP
jgi:hypothetical protein